MEYPLKYTCLVSTLIVHLSFFLLVFPFPLCLFLCWACVCVQVPEQLQDKEFAPVLQEQPLQPLALVPLTEEEQVRA